MYYSVLLSVALLTLTMFAKADESFSLAIIADCQYADKDSQGARLYRECPKKLAKAVDDINTMDVKAVLHLGDFIDEGYANFETLNNITAKSKVPVYHVLGNHDFWIDDSKKPLLTKVLGMPARYHTFDINNWRFIVLDGNDISHRGWPKSSQKHINNMEIIKEKYAKMPNWNGAMGEEQLKWLERELQVAKKAHKRVVILNHFPVYPVDPHVLWNHEQVMALLSKYNDVITAWFNGHNHKGDYGVKNGIHFVTFHAMLDTQQTAYSRVTFSDNQIQITGKGRQPDLLLKLTKQANGNGAEN